MKYLPSCILTASLCISPFNVLAHGEDVAPDDFGGISLEQLLNVEVFTASKFSQKTSEAPSRVTVITAEDIRVYGYRTLNDILESVPGLYSSYDRNYSYLGVRGFGLAGDYNTRVLLLLDGQRVNDNIYDSFGTDFDGLVNVDLIKRVEFSSGPGSAIYGANAFFGVINVITKSGEEIAGLQTSVDYASENSRRARITAGEIFENGVEMLLSVSAYKSDGADIYFPEFDDPTTNFGVAQGLDYEDAQNVLVKLKYGNWGFEAAYNDRTKGIPTASYGQEFNLAPSETVDTVSRAGLTYNAAISSSSEVYGSLSLGRYEYTGDFIYDYPPITINVDDALGEWWNLDVRYETTYFDKQRIILGAEYQNNSKQYQANFDVDPFASYLDDNRSSELYGLYLQDEIRLSSKFIVNAGIRYDHNTVDKGTSNNQKSIVNPRLALIYLVQPETTLKLLYGTAYRNANAYELYYGIALGYLPSGNLEPEEIESYELDLEHFFSNNFKFTSSIYSNHTTNLIGLNRGIATGDVFYDNLGDVDAVGADVELEYVAETGLKLRTSYSFVDTEDRDSAMRLTNSPEHMAKLNLSLPVFQHKAVAGLEFRYMGHRTTPLGDKLGGFGDYQSDTWQPEDL